jgi:endonuclease YncB( thermonuclease family)
VTPPVGFFVHPEYGNNVSGLAVVAKHCCPCIDRDSSRVIDGDTIWVSLHGQLVKVRLIGVDRPETVHPDKPVEPSGKEASKFTRLNSEPGPLNWRSTLPPILVAGCF